MPTFRTCRGLLTLGASLALLLPAAQADSLRIVARVDGSVTSLSADGRAAAGLSLSTFETFRWTARDGTVPLGRGTWLPLGHTSGTPRISADGNTVSATILSDDGSYSTAGRWTIAGGWSMLAPPLPPGGGQMDGEDSSAFSMSGDGQVVGGLFWRPGQSGGSAHAMAWTPATGMVDLGSSGNSSRVDGASADGRVLAGWDEHPTYGNRRAAVWVDGVLTVLEDSDWPSEASAVNADGSVVVGYSGNPADFQTYATMWTRQGNGWTKTLLGTIAKRRGSGYAYATGVSADGSIVVGGARPDVQSPQSVGFVWTASTGLVEATVYLQSAGITLPKLLKLVDMPSVSADGRTLAAGVQLAVQPWTSSTLLIRRTP